MQPLNRRMARMCMLDACAAASMDARRIHVCWSCMQPHQQLHSAPMRVGCACTALGSPPVLSNLTHSCTRKPGQNRLVLQTFNPCFLLLQNKL